MWYYKHNVARAELISGEIMWDFHGSIPGDSSDSNWIPQLIDINRRAMYLCELINEPSYELINGMNEGDYVTVWKLSFLWCLNRAHCNWNSYCSCRSLNHYLSSHQYRALRLMYTRCNVLLYLKYVVDVFIRGKRNF